jgi:hypothetical protein
LRGCLHIFISDSIGKLFAPVLEFLILTLSKLRQVWCTLRLCDLIYLLSYDFGRIHKISLGRGCCNTLNAGLKYLVDDLLFWILHHCLHRIFLMLIGRYFAARVNFVKHSLCHLHYLCLNLRLCYAFLHIVKEVVSVFNNRIFCLTKDAHKLL